MYGDENAMELKIIWLFSLVMVLSITLLTCVDRLYSGNIRYGKKRSVPGHVAQGNGGQSSNMIPGAAALPHFHTDRDGQPSEGQ
jgi:hypothetical protein